MPQLPELPRWLKIFGIAVIVLGVITCGIGGVRSFEQEPSRDTPPDEGFSFGVPAVPRGDVILENCAWATPPASSRFTGSNCRIVVDDELLPRDLRLRVISVSGILPTMTVGQEISGRLEESTKGVPAPGTVIDIRVTGSPVFVTISCGSCTFEVIE